ncbi:hypothetical protein NECAME_16330 [Necator americanus]|uniref:Uncharacterized protein n=1 Tax=Necator americanus TaxID=51031 RepID=W2TX74_NECAM|nr:hypothetical protein NECAME_16330 [Necator americanus]ETN86428.1 hypothetical protein NECAME_16330 [Necator americanus]
MRTYTGAWPMHGSSVRRGRGLPPSPRHYGKYSKQAAKAACFINYSLHRADCSELVRRSDLRETADIVVQRRVVAGLVERAAGKDRIERRRTVEDVVDAAVDRPVLDARIGDHQVELAIGTHFVCNWRRRRDRKRLRIRARKHPSQCGVPSVIGPIQRRIALPAREAAAERLRDRVVVARSVDRARRQTQREVLHICPVSQEREGPDLRRERLAEGAFEAVRIEVAEVLIREYLVQCLALRVGHDLRRLGGFTDYVIDADLVPVKADVRCTCRRNLEAEVEIARTLRLQVRVTRRDRGDRTAG